MKLYIRLYIVFLWLGCAYFANLYKTIVNMYNGEIRYNENKKTVTPFNMQEIARALREMISEDSPNASEALLSGTREAVFREIFIFIILLF